MHTDVNSTSKSVFISTQIQYTLCSPAHIKMITQCMPTFCNICGSVFATLVHIWFFQFFMVTGIGRMSNLSQNPTEKNQGGGGGEMIRYRDGAAQEVDSPKLIAVNKLTFKNVVTLLWMCCGVWSCWKTVSGLPSRSWSINHNSKTWNVSSPLRVLARMFHVLQ